jgi:hypothetical protein
MYSLELLGRQSARWSTIGLFLGYGLVAGWMAVRHMRRSPHPLIEFATLKVRTFAIVIWGGSLFRIAISVSPFLLPLMFQVPFGMSAFQSGLLILAMFAGNLSMKTITTPVLRRFGFRTVLIYNGLITGLLILSFSFLSPQTPKPLIVAVLFAHGLSRSMQFTCLATLAFVDIPKPLMSSATSFISVVTQMGMGMGVAVGAVALRLSAWILSEQTGVPTLTDFHVAFALVSLIAVIAVIDCFGLERNAGAEVSGHGA